MAEVVEAEKDDQHHDSMFRQIFRFKVGLCGEMFDIKKLSR